MATMLQPLTVDLYSWGALGSPRGDSGEIIPSYGCRQPTGLGDRSVTVNRVLWIVSSPGVVPLPFQETQGKDIYQQSSPKNFVKIAAYPAFD